MKKINFGIDLGTTNSALVKVNQGSLMVYKSEFQKDTTPSCVSFNKKGNIRVGDGALNGFRSDMRLALRKTDDNTSNTFLEFKRTMGTDKVYYSSNVSEQFSSEQLSAEVLKKLKTYVDNETVDAAVITVPAKFRQNQLDATQRAAKLAGFKYVDLLQEPIAASIAYGLESKNLNGFWIVFDFGGGTFDAALMKVDQGVMKVIDTEGDNHLGGKNIDYQVVDEIFFPFLRKNYQIQELENNPLKKALLRDALKSLAEEAKIQLSVKDKYEILTDEPICLDDVGEEIEVDLQLDVAQFHDVVRPIYQRSVDIIKTILDRNNMSKSQLNTIILVGGATYCRLIREMLAAQICPNVDTSIDPMLAIAKGAAVYASTRDAQITDTNNDAQQPYQQRDSNDILELDITYPSTTTEMEVKVGIKILNKDEKNYSYQLARNDGAWTSETIKFNNDRAVLSVLLLKDTINTFKITMISDQGDIVAFHPNYFSIIQGMDIANATLPYSICIDVFNSKRQADLLALLPGLEKNQKLPAKGKALFYTPSDIRPGHNEDRIEITIYEGDPETRAVYNEPIGKLSVTGEHVNRFIPAHQEIEVMLEVDSSRRMKLSVYLPYIDESIDFDLPEMKQNEYDSENIVAEINTARDELFHLKGEPKQGQNEKVLKLSNELDVINTLLQNSANDYNTKTQVVERLREICIIIDNLKYQNEWPKVEEVLREGFESMGEIIQTYGDENHAKQFALLQKMANQILVTKDIPNAKLLIEKIMDFRQELINRNPQSWVYALENFEMQFDLYSWNDRQLAKDTMDYALQNISNAAVVKSSVLKLFSLLPNEENEEILRPIKNNYKPRMN
ncbi:Hsp70 family protein [Flavobacterium sp.]|uniref:Hsp70 family protein n=1 Tax=Flavobacterium sp. TaxID=239 RepID=UPI0026298C3C|nr:Hsp70 family protein [Flavobacterium sp.]